MGCATLWAIFSQTHLGTLETAQVCVKNGKINFLKMFI
jgi:hypothetical protein